MGLLETAANIQPSSELPESSSPATASEPEHAADAAAAGDIERLREMLFGEELKRHRESLAAMQAEAVAEMERIQARLLATVEAADERWTHRANAIERSIGTQLAELHQRIEAETSQRGETTNILERQVGAMKNELAETVTELREAQRSYEEEVRTQLLSQGELLSKSIHRHHDQAMQAVNETGSELRHSKADRDTVAELFLEVAERLTLES